MNWGPADHPRGHQAGRPASSHAIPLQTKAEVRTVGFPSVEAGLGASVQGEGGREGGKNAMGRGGRKEKS